MPIESLFPQLPPIHYQNVHHLLFRREDQKTWPDYTLHIEAETGRRRTYQEFLEYVYDGATALANKYHGPGLDVNKGHLVGVLSGNCLDYIPFLQSCIAITVPFTLFPSFTTIFELEHNLGLSKCTHLFVHPDLLPLAQQVAQKLGHSDEYIYILQGRVPGRKSFAEMIESIRKLAIPRTPIRVAGRDTLAYLIFSSGTNGRPKAIMISHGNLSTSLIQVGVLGMEVSKVVEPPTYLTPEGLAVHLAFLPLYHSLGLLGFNFRAFLSRSTAVILGKFSVDTFVELIPRYKITNVFLVPSVVHQLVNSQKFRECDKSTLLSFLSGGSYLPPDLAKRLIEVVPQADIYEGFGMSETTFAATHLPWPGILGGLVPVPGSMGILLPGMSARIMRPDGITEAAVGETGDFYLKGGTIALGYWDNEEATEDAFVQINGERWLKTGDRVRVDDKCNFFFDDRAKDTLKISGEQVAPLEIEDILRAHPDKLITDVTVAGVSGFERTSDEKVPRAWVVLSSTGHKLGEAGTIRSLDAWVRKNLSKHKWLRGGVEVVAEVPKSPTGKALRRLLQEQYEAGIKSKL